MGRSPAKALRPFADMAHRAGAVRLAQRRAMEPRGFFLESQDPIPRTWQGEVWIEATACIVEEKGSRLLGDPTEEALVCLAFKLCAQRTEDL